MKIKQIIVFLIFVLISGKLYSQLSNQQKTVRLSIPEIAILDIEPSYNNSIYISLEQPVKPGVQATIQKTSNKTLWINYTSSLLNSKNSRIIKAEISGGKIPDGIDLYLEVSDFSGSGKGKTGESSGKIKLTNYSKPIITGIGNCYTGDGIMNGHSLSFSLEINNYAKVHSISDADFTILYTITDN